MTDKTDKVADHDPTPDPKKVQKQLDDFTSTLQSVTTATALGPQAQRVINALCQAMGWC